MLKKSLEKGSRKDKRKMNPSPLTEGKTLEGKSPHNDFASHAPTVSKGTKRDSSYKSLCPMPNIATNEEQDNQIVEFIHNMSLHDFLSEEGGLLRHQFTTFRDFMMKVYFLSIGYLWITPLYTGRHGASIPSL